jgi:hypothetical protein
MRDWRTTRRQGALMSKAIRFGNGQAAVHPDCFTLVPKVDIWRKSQGGVGAAIWWLWFEFGWVKPVAKPSFAATCEHCGVAFGLHQRECPGLR